MRTALTIVLGAWLLLAGCAGKPARPDWTAGSSARYPDTRFLVARGQGPTESKAADRARAELAKIFHVRISDESVDTQTIVSRTERGKTQREQRGKVTRTVVAGTDRILEGVEVKEFWLDPHTQVHYALAVLPRARASARLEQRMAHLDAATRDYLAQVHTRRDVLLRLGAAERALTAQHERQALQDSLRIVDPAGRGMAPRWELSDLQREFEKLLPQLQLVLEVQADPIGGLGTALSGAIAAAGFTLAQGAQADYVLAATLQMDDLGKRDGWLWLKGTLEIKLVEQTSARVRGVQRWTVKVSAQQRRTARRRAVDRVVSILKQELQSTIVSFGGGAGGRASAQPWAGAGELRSPG